MCFCRSSRAPTSPSSTGWCTSSSRKTFTTRNMSRPAARALTSSKKTLEKYTPGACGGDLRHRGPVADRKGRADPGGCEADGALLLHGYHPVQVRGQRREVLRQSPDAAREPRRRGRRGKPAARPEQRAGRLRHGRAQRGLPGLPAGGERGQQEKVQERMEGRVRPVGQAGPDDRRVAERGHRRGREGALRAGREPRHVRSRTSTT